MEKELKIIKTNGIARALFLPHITSLCCQFQEEVLQQNLIPRNIFSKFVVSGLKAILPLKEVLQKLLFETSTKMMNLFALRRAKAGGELSTPWHEKRCCSQGNVRNLSF